MEDSFLNPHSTDASSIRARYLVHTLCFFFIFCQKFGSDCASALYQFFHRVKLGRCNLICFLLEFEWGDTRVPKIQCNDVTLMVLRSAWVACCLKRFGKRYKLDLFTSNFWCLWFAVSVFGVDVFNLLFIRVWVRGYSSSKNCLQWCDALMVFAICLELFVVQNVLEKDTN